MLEIARVELLGNLEFSNLKMLVFYEILKVWKYEILKIESLEGCKLGIGKFGNWKFENEVFKLIILRFYNFET